MRQFNIGPETLVRMLPEKDDELKQEWRDKGYIVCASGAVFQKEDGNLKKIITELYLKRKSYKKTSFKYQQNYYDIKEMISNNVGMDEINDYLVKNEIHNVVNEDGEGRLKAIMNYCLMMSDIYNNYQLGTKVVINGIYGAFGFSGFYFYNKNIAEAVTKQGKHAILNAEILINKWAQKVWLKDKKTHKMMGVKIKPECENIKIDSITRYIDTDSLTSDSIINILDEVVIINNIAYNVSDSIRIMRNGVEMVVNVSDIQKTDLIWQERN
jgi:DNA polymerase elongation subunit (family B)